MSWVKLYLMDWKSEYYHAYVVIVKWVISEKIQWVTGVFLVNPLFKSSIYHYIIHFNFYWKLIRYPRNVPWLLMLHFPLVKSGNLKPLNICRTLFKLSQRITPLTFVISLPKQVPCFTFVFENSPNSVPIYSVNNNSVLIIVFQL